MNSIAHLPPSEQQHYTLCNLCTQWVDMRNLSSVFEHLHIKAKLPAEWSGSRRKGDSTWYPNRDVRTNPKLHKRINTAIIRRLNQNLKRLNQN